MLYIRTQWVDKSTNGSVNNNSTPINAKNLNNIEDGIELSLEKNALALRKDVGFIAFYCKSTPPDGWLVCDGRAVSRTTYSDLFNCIGETFGRGNGATTFNLPDLRGEFIRGWNGSSSGTDANRSFGTKQNATRFTDDEMGARYVSDGESTGTASSYKGGSAGADHRSTIRIRPNNIALLPCIYTGVFSN